MMRLLAYFILIFAVATVVHLAQGKPGLVTVEWFGYRIQTSAILLAIAFFISTLVFLVWGRVWSWLNNTPKRLQYNREHQREKEGLKSVLLGLEALAAEKEDVAAKHSRKAAKLLPESPLSALLQAEASTADKGVQEQNLKAMLAHKETKFIGLKGLILQSVKQEDWQAAEHYIHEAYKLQPNAPWVLKMKTDILLHCKKYEELTKIFPKLENFNIYETDYLSLMQASIYAELGHLYADKEYNKAIKYINSGLKIVPMMTPLITQITDVYIKNNEKAKADKILADYWLLSMRNDVLDRWIDLSYDPKNAKRSFSRMAKVLNKATSKAHASFALAKVFIKGEEWQKARELLMTAKNELPNREVYELLALIEDANSPNSKAGYEWLQLAVSAENMPQQGELLINAYQKWRAIYVDGKKPNLLLDTYDNTALAS